MALGFKTSNSTLLLLLCQQFLLKFETSFQIIYPLKVILKCEYGKRAKNMLYLENVLQKANSGNTLQK